MTSRKRSLNSAKKKTTQLKPKPKTKPKPKPKYKSKPIHKSPNTRCKKSSGTVDRISKLPEHLLHHILSFLPQQEAGCTSILSHRWRNVWASMQSLNFFMDEYEEYGQERFTSYVNAALACRLKQDFNVFKTFLFSASPTNRAASARWIAHAVKNNVRVLHVIIRLKNSGVSAVLSRPMLTSDSLEELALFCFPNVKIKTPNVISLGRLKVLSLQRVDVNSIFMERIMSGCPRLETLNLHNCRGTFSVIYSDVLKSLVLEHCGIQVQNDRKFRICAPNLVHLRFNQGYAISSFHVKLDERHYHNYKVDVENFKLDVRNLKSLMLGGYWVASYLDVVSFFLQHTPALEKLTLNCIQGPGYWNDLNSVKLSNDLLFRCPNLSSVNIIYDEPDKRIRHLIQLFKKNGVSNLNLMMDGLICSDDDRLKMLQAVWFWINGQVLSR